MFGHKLRYEIKDTFGEISFKLRQTNWNVAIINANVVVDELPSELTIYNCLTIDIWTQRRRCTSTRFYALQCHMWPLTRTCFNNGSLLSEVEEVLCENPSSDSKYVH